MDVLQKGCTNTNMKKYEFIDVDKIKHIEKQTINYETVGSFWVFTLKSTHRTENVDFIYSDILLNIRCIVSTK